MRALTVIAVLLAGGTRCLCAQHGGQIEIGGFASYNRYDSRFQLDNQFGAGAWLGFFLGDHFSLEVDGDVAQPRSTVSGVGSTTTTFASATVAPATALPLGSVTVPRNDVEAVWQTPMPFKISRHASTDKVESLSHVISPPGR